jgi:hypothetical protein
MSGKVLNIKVLVVTHKPCTIPVGEYYFPVQAGSILSEDIGFTKDSSGKNISYKNPMYSELTALYWAWKNMNCDWLGLTHYRRFFTLDKLPFGDREPLNDAQIKGLVASGKIIVPKKRRYFIENLKSHYEHTHIDGELHLSTTRTIIKEAFPEVLNAWDKVMKRSWGYMSNMFIAPWDFIDRYCKWLFFILEELDQKTDSSVYTAFDKRYIGRVAELLWNVWVENEKAPLREVPWGMPGTVPEQSKQWWKKTINFLAAKYGNKKYGASI